MTDERINEILREAFSAEEAGNLEVAIRLFKRASRLGSNDARSKLGTIYDDVVKRPNPDRAVYWYRRGVKGGESSCAWNLAMHYAGLGRRRGYLHWLRVATAMGDPDAATELASNHWWKKRNTL
jgi:TPR repeat protein